MFRSLRFLLICRGSCDFWNCWFHLFCISHDFTSSQWQIISWGRCLSSISSQWLLWKLGWVYSSWFLSSSCCGTSGSGSSSPIFSLLTLLFFLLVLLLYSFSLLFCLFLCLKFLNYIIYILPSHVCRPQIVLVLFKPLSHRINPLIILSIRIIFVRAVSFFHLPPSINVSLCIPQLKLKQSSMQYCCYTFRHASFQILYLPHRDLPMLGQVYLLTFFFFLSQCIRYVCMP